MAYIAPRSLKESGRVYLIFYQFVVELVELRLKQFVLFASFSQQLFIIVCRQSAPEKQLTHVDR